MLKEKIRKHNIIGNVWLFLTPFSLLLSQILFILYSYIPDTKIVIEGNLPYHRGRGLSARRTSTSIWQPRNGRHKMRISSQQLFLPAEVWCSGISSRGSGTWVAWLWVEPRLGSVYYSTKQHVSFLYNLYFYHFLPSVSTSGLYANFLNHRGLAYWRALCWLFGIEQLTRVELWLSHAPWGC
jgi:hypothetical protein